MITQQTACSAKQIDDMARLLQQAFFDDPFFGLLMPDADKRVAQLFWWMRCAVRYVNRYGGIYVTQPSTQGVAMWLKPDAPIIDTLKIASTGLILAPFRLGLGRFLYAMRVFGQWEYLQKMQPVRHWYLMLVGVLPECQGQGVGSALLQPVLQQADRDLLVCYLETAAERDVSFYQKHGFDVLNKGDLGDGFSFWTMRRLPERM